MTSPRGDFGLEDIYDSRPEPRRRHSGLESGALPLYDLAGKSSHKDCAE